MVRRDVMLAAIALSVGVVAARRRALATDASGEDGQSYTTPRRSVRMAALVAVLTYAAWLVMTSRAKVMRAHWGHPVAARTVATLCWAVGTLLGVRFAFKFDTQHDSNGPFPSKARYVAAVGPHGVFPLSLLGFGAWGFREGLGRWSDPNLTQLDARIAGASVLFWVPFLRELLLLAGVRDASRPNLMSLLANGHTIAVNPGGIWEMVNSDHGQEKMYMQKNLGFVRIAMEAGLPLLPAYAFGENQLFTTSRVGLGLRLWIARKLRVGVPIFFGRWGLPWTLPRPTPVTFVVGRPVPVGPPNPNPTDAEVEAVFNRYVDEMCRIFRDNAPLHLPEQVAARGLQIHRIGRGIVRHSQL